MATGMLVKGVGNPSGRLNSPMPGTDSSAVHTPPSTEEIREPKTMEKSAVSEKRMKMAGPELRTVRIKISRPFTLR
eukprot:6189136-Pleurochrysis_carterae.AAC.3